VRKKDLMNKGLEPSPSAIYGRQANSFVRKVDLMNKGLRPHPSLLESSWPPLLVRKKDLMNKGLFVEHFERLGHG